MDTIERHEAARMYALAGVAALCALPATAWVAEAWNPSAHPWRAAAQVPEHGTEPAWEVSPGTRVRVKFADTPRGSLRTFTGTLTGNGGDMLLIRSDRDEATFPIPAASIRRVDVWAGRRGSGDRGALIGLGVGMASGVALGYIEGDDRDCWILCWSAGEKAAIYGISLGLVGTGVGAIVGAGIQRDKWQEKPSRPTRPSLSVGPPVGGGSGLAVGGTFRF